MMLTSLLFKIELLIVTLKAVSSFSPGHVQSMNHRLPTTSRSLLKPTQEWDVTRYQSQHNFVYKYGASLLELVQASPGERILDVGCGSGELTQALYETNSNAVVMGCDADVNMLSRAREQYPHMEWFVADMRELSLSEPVDVIFSNAALHWVPPADAPRMVQAVANCLGPGGRFVVEFGGKGNVEKIVEACREVLGVNFEFWYFPSIGEFTSLLEQNGIEVTTAVLYDRATPLEDGENGVRNWLSMFGNKFFENVSEEELEDSLKKIENKLRPDLWDGEQWMADYRRIRIVGKKG